MVVYPQVFKRSLIMHQISYSLESDASYWYMIIELFEVIDLQKWLLNAL